MNDYLVSRTDHALGDIQCIEPFVTQFSIQYRNNNLIYSGLICCMHGVRVCCGGNKRKERKNYRWTWKTQIARKQTSRHLVNKRTTDEKSLLFKLETYSGIQIQCLNGVIKKLRKHLVCLTIRELFRVFRYLFFFWNLNFVASHV